MIIDVKFSIVGKTKRPYKIKVIDFNPSDNKQVEDLLNAIDVVINLYKPASDPMADYLKRKKNQIKQYDDFLENLMNVIEKGNLEVD